MRGGRSENLEDRLKRKYDGCGKVCKSKAGLMIHVRRIHEAARKLFKCGRCQEEFQAEANLKNHKKSCGGGARKPGNGKMRELWRGV